MILTEPGRRSCKAVVVATSDRELALKTDDWAILHRNRRFVQVDKQATEPEEEALVPFQEPPLLMPPPTVPSAPGDGQFGGDAPASSSNVTVPAAVASAHVCSPATHRTEPASRPRARPQNVRSSASQLTPNECSIPTSVRSQSSASTSASTAVRMSSGRAIKAPDKLDL